jgi:hypothetical protein
MDAKQAIELFKRMKELEMLGVKITYYQVQLAEPMINLLESLAREAALGRAAVEAIDSINLKFCPKDGVKLNADPCRHCKWSKFCTQRAEIDKKK